MKQTIWNIRIPTFLALLFLIISVVVTSALVQQRIITIGRASPDTLPENISVANNTEVSFSVVFSTQEKVQSHLEYGQSAELGQVAYDVRDTNSRQSEYYSHMLQASGLKPDTAYFFRIVSNGTTILNNEELFTTKTALEKERLQNDDKKISGSILTPDGGQTDDSLIVIKAEGAQTIASLSNALGEYEFEATNIRKSDLSENFVFSDTTPLNIHIIHAGLTSEVKTLYHKAFPIPIVTLSKNYDFRTDIPVIEDSTIIQSELEVPQPSGPAVYVSIQNPENNEEFIDQQPVFNGSAPPNQKVKIIIESENPITTEVTTSSAGQWQYRPTQPLAPGIHTITIEAIDQFGIIKRIKKQFTVYAQGSQLSIEGTPTPTPLTPSPTSIPSIVPTTQQTTPSPTLLVSPILPIDTPTPTIFIEQIPTNPPMPTMIEQPGDNTGILLLTFSSAFLIIAGVVLLFAL